jgi:hypothetical protein
MVWRLLEGGLAPRLPASVSNSKSLARSSNDRLLFIGYTRVRLAGRYKKMRT